MKKEDLEKAKELEARIKALELLKVTIILSIVKNEQLKVQFNAIIAGAETNTPIYLSKHRESCKNTDDIDFVIRAIDVRIENLNEEFKKI